MAGLDGSTPFAGFMPPHVLERIMSHGNARLQQCARLTLQADHGVQPMLLIGMDLVKDPSVLEAAYDDVIKRGLKSKAVLEWSMEQHVKMCVENSEDVFDARILAKELKMLLFNNRSLITEN